MPAKKRLSNNTPENQSAKYNTPVKKFAGKRIAASTISSRPTQQMAIVKKNPSTDSFFDSVFQVARLIPKGRVSTYGAIAEYLGSKLSARMVGWAMNAAGSADPPVPAHRVVNRNGMLSGKHHYPTPTLMEELLQQEKIKVKDDKIVDFDKLLWKPGESD
jgi:methylated-DNA-protein-cysteine methyltransferase-like protein